MPAASSPWQVLPNLLTLRVARLWLLRKMKIRGIYWDEKSGKLLKASIVGEVDVANADACKRARELGIALAGKIRAQL